MFSISDKHELVDWLWRLGTPIILDEIIDSYTFYQNSVKLINQFKKQGYQVCVPLCVRSRLVGLLLLGKKEENKYTLEDIDILETFANNSAVAIQNFKLQRNLQETKELESFYKFTSFVIHDLRNVVSVLAMLSENAKTNMENVDFRKSMVQTLSDSVNNMRGMLSKISMSTGKVNRNLEHINIADLLRNVVSELEFPDSIRFKANIAEDTLIQTDPIQLRKVVINLLMNAFEAITGNGEVEIEMKVEDKSSLPAEFIDEWHEDKFIKIAVKDNGIGMTAEYVEKKLFRPFQTTKKKGLGIGLYHCQEIIKSLHGKMWVQSNLKTGTTFFIALSTKPSISTAAEKENGGDNEFVPKPLVNE